MAFSMPCRFFAENRCAKGDACTFSHDLGKGYGGKGEYGKGDYGKGKGKSKGSAEGGKGHTLPRVRISAEKFSGEVSAWKGKYGFITPSEQIEHEKASLHNGSLFFSKDDFEGSGDIEVGASVQFHICEDDSGLGAEEVVQVGPAPKGAGKGKGGKDNGKGFGKAATKGSSWAAPAMGASWGATQYAAPAKGSSWSQTQYASPKGVKGWSDTGSDKGKGKGWFDKGMGKGGKDGKDGNKGKGHMLPRTRISAEKFTGTVNAWKGKYGWIQPAEEIGHEKAAKHKGGLFVSKDDLVGAEALTEGSTVEFHIWEDASGLGAEEVVQF
mmetsp:Transcript_141347/g.451452  ORF Transcript_141347/g.451452 Transcript_141347/m.451452 type:complete len:325 (+) Transcript_141347:125-1099(+)